MKIAIIGSRELGNVNFFATMEKLVSTMNDKPDEVISGGAAGYDTMAAIWAKEKGLKLTEYKPDYKKNGRAATFIRNRRIVDDSDAVIAFWNGISRGTKYTIDYAEKKNKQIIIVDTNGNKLH